MRFMEEKVVIGGQNRMFVRNGAVHRPSHPWSDGTRRLLEFSRGEGLEFVPEWRGRDEHGNEIFEYIEGEVGNYLQDKHHELYLRDIRALTTLHEAI